MSSSLTISLSCFYCFFTTGMTINDQELKVEVSINTRDKKAPKVIDGSDGEHDHHDEQATTL